MLNAMTRIAADVDKKVEEYNKTRNENISVRYWFDRVATSADTDVIVKMCDFAKANKELVPSVSHDELAHYLRIKANFEGST